MDDPVVVGETVNVPIEGATLEAGVVSDEPKIVETDMWKQGYSAARRKAEQRAQEEQVQILSRFGVESFDDLAGLIDNAQSVDPAVPANDDMANKIKTLKTEREQLRRKVTEYDRLKGQHDALSRSAIASDVRSRLMALDAHTEGIEDLVKVVMPHLQWSDDRSKIQVVLTDDDGEMIPSPQPLDEWLLEQRVKRPYFFKSSGVKGTGSSGSAAPITEQMSTLKSRLAAMKAGRQ